MKGFNLSLLSLSVILTHTHTQTPPVVQLEALACLHSRKAGQRICVWEMYPLYCAQHVLFSSARLNGGAGSHTLSHTHTHTPTNVGKKQESHVMKSS